MTFSSGFKSRDTKLELLTGLREEGGQEGTRQGRTPASLPLPFSWQLMNWKFWAGSAHGNCRRWVELYHFRRLKLEPFLHLLSPSSWLPSFYPVCWLLFHECIFTIRLPSVGDFGVSCAYRNAFSSFDLQVLSFLQFQAFLVVHLWCYDRFQCIKWGSGRQPGAFKRVMTCVNCSSKLSIGVNQPCSYSYLATLPMLMIFSVGMAVLSYQEGTTQTRYSSSPVCLTHLIPCI